MSAEYILYGAELSLYSGKARAYLRYKDLAWEERLAVPEVYEKIIVPVAGAPIIPVLATSDGEAIQDTTEIIDYLEARHPEAPVYPDSPKQRLVALLFELFGDEWLVIPAMHYRWSVLDQQYDFIMSEFGNLSAPDGTLEEKIALGEKTSSRFRNSVSFLGITEQTIPGVERAYRQLLAQLNAHFSQYDFLLGSRPSIGDFGLMGPLYAHLGRDPVPKALMQETAPAVYQWVERMNNPQARSGDFLPDDEIPPTLLPILQTMFEEQLPDVLDVIEHNAAWLEGNPGGNIPRFLGMHSFTIGGSEGQRIVHSYAQWLFQRSLDYYQSVGAEEKRELDELLNEVGGHEALQVVLSHRVKRQKGQLELVEDTA